MSQKRERSINFTREEVDILIKLVEQNKEIIENKKSDAVTWNQKEECWKAIEASFNAAHGSTHRTSKNLRLKYEGIKRDTRKKSALIRAETYRTGGGPSTAPVLATKIIHSPRGEIDETPVRPLKRTLFDTQDTTDLGEAGPETVKKWSQWKPTSLRSKKHPVLCKPKAEQPFEKVADSKMEITMLQKQILEEEFVNKKLEWASEEEKRQHKREMWQLEKKLILKNLDE